MRARAHLSRTLDERSPNVWPSAIPRPCPLLLADPRSGGGHRSGFRRQGGAQTHACCGTILVWCSPCACQGKHMPSNTKSCHWGTARLAMKSCQELDAPPTRVEHTSGKRDTSLMNVTLHMSMASSSHQRGSVQNTTVVARTRGARQVSRRRSLIAVWWCRARVGKEGGANAMCFARPLPLPWALPPAAPPQPPFLLKPTQPRPGRPSTNIDHSAKSDPQADIRFVYMWRAPLPWHKHEGERTA